LLIATSSLAAVVSAGCESSHPPPPPSPVAQAVMDERAITLLKQMSTTLAAAKGFSFRAVSTEAVESPAGEWVHVFGTSAVTFQRQGGLMVETGGDLAEHKFYFDGATATMYSPHENLYAQQAISSTVDKMLMQLFEEHGESFAFSDLLQSDPYGAMMNQTGTANSSGSRSSGACRRITSRQPGAGWRGNCGSAPTTTSRGC